MAKTLVTLSTFNLDNFQHLDEIQLLGIGIVINPYGSRLCKGVVSGLMDS